MRCCVSRLSAACARGRTDTTRLWRFTCLAFSVLSNLNRGQDTRANGPDTQRAQAHNHTQNSNPRTHPRQTSRSHAHTTHTHTLHFLFTGHSQSAVISRSHPALTPPPSLRPAPPLPVKHKYRVLASSTASHSHWNIPIYCSHRRSAALPHNAIHDSHHTLSHSPRKPSKTKSHATRI